VGFVMELPATQGLHPLVAHCHSGPFARSGNVGSILRSAGAFGFGQVMALKGTVPLWSPKVLRAGMGAHFGLRLIEGLDTEALEALQVPMVVTSSHQRRIAAPPNLRLPSPCAWACWAMKGRASAPHWRPRPSGAVRIAQPGGEESLNVAAAAAPACQFAYPPVRPVLLSRYNGRLSRKQPSQAHSSTFPDKTATRLRQESVLERAWAYP
jgi:TrmH family RNA methyltransferase